MKRRYYTIVFWLAIWLLATALLANPSAWAKPTTPEQAQTVVLNWIGLDAMPLGAAMGQQIKEVQTFNHGGTAAYYVVHLIPAGLVFVPADDLVEPIIGFLPQGFYDPSPANPLGALVSRDITGRVLEARAVKVQGPEALAPETPQAVARRKWDWLAQPTIPKASESSPRNISDVLVAPLIQSRWAQKGVNGEACYNYYTPPNAEGTVTNYPCSCVATAMAQLMRFWLWPQNGIGRLQKTYYVDDPDQPDPITGYTRGGDDLGGAYVWGDMPLVPSAGVTLAQRQAIGRLTWDAGLSVRTAYSASSSGGFVGEVAAAFVNTFGYGNAISAYNSGNNIPGTNRNLMINPNLHAGYPVILEAIVEETEYPTAGHVFICDGYGYNSSTMYHHLNLGWADGAEDLWYNLPTIDTSKGTYFVIDRCIYNIYPEGTGEIIAGRVTNAGGSPLSGVTVSATGGYTTTTDANGFYALVKVPSGTTFTVTARKTGYTASVQAVTTGTSTNNSITTGNQGPINFTLRKGSIVPIFQLMLD